MIGTARSTNRVYNVGESSKAIGRNVMIIANELPAPKTTNMRARIPYKIKDIGRYDRPSQPKAHFLYTYSAPLSSSLLCCCLPGWLCRRCRRCACLAGPRQTHSTRSNVCRLSSPVTASQRKSCWRGPAQSYEQR